MKVCIVGGTGNLGVFVGEELIRRGHSIASFSRDKRLVPIRIRDTRTRVWFGDIADKEEVVEFFKGENPDVVLLTTAPERNCPEKYIPGHDNVLQACRECGIKRIVILSNHMGLLAPNGKPMMEVKPPHFTWFYDVQNVYRLEWAKMKEVKDLDWELLCPGLQCVPFGGEKGEYRVQENTIIVADPINPDWNTSRISYEDYVDFVTDQIENPTYNHKYMTASY